MVRWILAALLVSTTAHADVGWADVEAIAGIDGMIVTGESTHVVAKLGGRWFVTTEPIGLYDTLTVTRAFDASLLAKQPAVALVVESRDGGSEMGSAIDQLVILCAANERLRKCGELEIGHLEWALDGEHRRAYPDGASSLRKRPHVEVVLDPTLVAPDMLRLTLTRNSTVALPDGGWPREIIDAMDALRKSAGLYRFVAGTLVRVN